MKLIDKEKIMRKKLFVGLLAFFTFFKVYAINIDTNWTKVESAREKLEINKLDTFLNKINTITNNYKNNDLKNNYRYRYELNKKFKEEDKFNFTKKVLQLINYLIVIMKQMHFIII